ncbi:MAG: hypothetical protein R6U38_10605, partial [Desulfatiglandaceae bacterium]
LKEGYIFSLLVLRIQMLQKREYINFPEVIEEGIEQGGLIHGIDHIHFPAMEEVICDFGIIALSSVPEEAVAKGFLELVSAGHVGRLSTKGRGCQVGVSLFI